MSAFLLAKGAAMRELIELLDVRTPEEAIAAVRAIRDLLGEQNAILADALKAVDVEPIEGETFAEAAAGELRRLHDWQEEALTADKLTVSPIRAVVAELNLGEVGDNVGQVAADALRRALQANVTLSCALSDVGVLAKRGETFAEAAAAALRFLFNSQAKVHAELRRLQDELLRAQALPRARQIEPEEEHF